jgi:uncharacterized lipoprotein YmbA
MVCLAVLAAAACESTPPDYYYLQSLGPAEAGIDDYQARLVVEEVTLPNYLNRSDIVTQQQVNRLDVAETEKWAEPLDAGVARVLRADLAHLLAERRVLVTPRDFTDPDARLYVHISRFEVSGGSEAVLDAQWRLERSRDRRELVLRQSQHRQPITGEGYPAITAALNETLHNLSRDIAAAVAEQADLGAL